MRIISKTILGAVLSVAVLTLGVARVNAAPDITITTSDPTVATVGTITPAAPANSAATNVATTPAVVSAPVVATNPQDAGANLITVDLVIFAGQSNMSGAGGNKDSAPGVPHGKGYEFRNGQDPMGMYEVKEPFGERENGYLSDPVGLRGGTLVSSFMNTYYNRTGVPVLGLSAARGGTALSYWNSPAVQAELMNKYTVCKAWCASNNVRIRRQYVVWLQGETDAIAGMDSATYREQLKAVFTPLFAKGLEQVFVVTIGNFGGLPGAFDQVVDGQIRLCINDPYFTLGTDILHKLPDTYLVDGVHYSQSALNQAGNLTAVSAASYSALIK